MRGMESNRMLRKRVLWGMVILVVACVAMTVYAVVISLRPVAESAEKKNQETLVPSTNPAEVEPLGLPEPQWLEEVKESEENLLT